MLAPREADVPALFLVLVVLPLIAYIILGRWSDISKRKEKIGLLAQLVAEESLREEVMGVDTVSHPSPASLSKDAIHECASCHALATTRCSRCKSVRYCSGKCQIIHWRNLHKDECQPSESIWRKSTEKRVTHITSRKVRGREETSASCSAGDISEDGGSSKETRNKSNDAINCGDDISMRIRYSSIKVSPGEKIVSRESANVGSEGELGNNYLFSGASHHMPIRKDVDKVFARKSSVDYRSFCKDGVHSNGRVRARKSFSGILSNGETSDTSQNESVHHSEIVIMSKSHKPVAKSSKDQVHSAKERKQPVSKEPGKVARVGGNAYGAQSLKKSAKISRKDASEVIDAHTTVKFQMLFPYEEFVKIFQCEIANVTPRGLLNCGNSCYANAVLQCLTCTKPLVVYLLRRTHSRSCNAKSWCLMCELGQYAQMLRQSGGPLSLSRILSRMRSMNCPMGDGSQEDAHEFLRLLVASMQSTCLEEHGGEKRVHPLLQETTFVQHTFGGCLRSRVTCLNCHHESERCENIMDLTLEIFGRVESLEDALRQFTSPEDLDGDNMYKCGRCASYVRARKQLSIDEAPNILTIVLKRFQEGNFGKINKCITFPEMLDIIPFMTGTYDVPPLYMLYGVVVHMDTLNASFSGHYVSYVKDLRGNWLRIDDSEVQIVPMSQVMCEGAYILFYMRSYPRPWHANNYQQSQSSGKTHKSWRSKGRITESSSVVYNNYQTSDTFTSGGGGASCSDWSLLTTTTSSDEAASFTTESTRDSISTTTDYPAADGGNAIPDTLNYSFFNSLHGQRTVSSRMFADSRVMKNSHRRR